jgi:hypothetical protein
MMRTPLISDDGKHKLYAQTTTSPDERTPAVVLPPSTFKLDPLSGQYVLLLIPTADEEEKHLLQSVLQDHIDEPKLVVYAYDVDTGFEQLYDDAGIECLQQRLLAMVDVAESSAPVLEELGIGTVIIGVVENYIRTSACDASPVDFGIVVFYNATTGGLFQRTTRGVPLQPSYVKEAQELGLSSARQNIDGVRYWEIIELYFGKPARQQCGSESDISKDWYQVVCGSSRHLLLADACRGCFRDLAAILPNCASGQG